MEASGYTESEPKIINLARCAKNRPVSNSKHVVNRERNVRRTNALKLNVRIAAAYSESRLNLAGFLNHLLKSDNNLPCRPLPKKGQPCQLSSRMANSGPWLS